ncbi:hypothetical protein [Paenibacillus silvae]|nr:MULTISPECIES: hypothetical protein [Paenibacillus]
MNKFIDAPDMKAAAFMLAKQFGYLWAFPLVISMTFHHQHVTWA